jgi:hypothetical protein
MLVVQLELFGVKILITAQKRLLSSLLLDSKCSFVLLVFLGGSLFAPVPENNPRFMGDIK